MTPKAAKNAFGDVITNAAGETWLKAAVTALPEKGKANKALLKLLSKSLGVGMRRLTLIAGAKDRYKTIHVAGDTAETAAVMEKWLATRDAE